MTDDRMTEFRCWSAENIAQTVFSDIGALAGDADSVFLAAHTPMDLEHRRGVELGGEMSGEARVLEALTRRIGDSERNTLVAVTGSSGSGKSHVVRWVHAHLPSEDPRFQVLYVPRAIQTLRELLRRVIEGLPGVEGADLLKRVDSAFTGVKPGELQERLVSELKIALNWTLDDRAPYDGETPDAAAKREDRNNMLGVRDQERGRRDGLAELIDLPAFKESLLRQDGALGQLVQSYFRKTSRRDDNDAIFTADDLPLRARGIRSEIRSRTELYELWQIIVQNPQDATKLLEEALRVALPKAVGLRVAGGDTLDSLFRASRKALRARGQELVLIFEDLAQFGLVDGELYDQFVTQPGDDLAPLRVIFAITDGPYADLERTVLTRIEHEFHVGGSALGQPHEFVGRYLNLARVGRGETQRLWSMRDGESSDTTWMTNSCDTRENGLACRHRDVCHSSFGTAQIEGLGDVGLYPYNGEALHRALTKLGEARTPREVLDHCVSEILTEADVHIAQRSYPHERARDQFDFKVRMAKDALLKTNPSIDPERAYRALVIWGDESPLPPGVIDAFSLGIKVSATSTGTATSTKRPTARDTSEISERPKLENKLLALFQWQNGEELPEDDVNILRTTLCGLTIDRLHLDQQCVHIYNGRGKVILDKLFNMTSFIIAGSRGAKAGAGSVRFDLERTAEDTMVMAAARWFRDHGHFDPTQAKWEWPQGYDPGQLMLTLETRLDAWAAEVRDRFLNQTGGKRLAQYAIGLYAVALATAGHDANKITSTASVLGGPRDTPNIATPAWAAADEIANRVLSSLEVEGYVGEFAAVRQGVRGMPQLVDPLALDEAVRQFLTDPSSSLEEAKRIDVDPVLARAAQQLLDVVSASAPAEAATVQANAERVETLLEGESPAVVGRAVEAVGEAASFAGFFRPSDQLGAFRRHVSTLSSFPTIDLPPTSSGDAGDLIRGQSTSRQVAVLADALESIRQVMELTKAECARSSAGGGDITAVRDSVRSKLLRLDRIATSLEPQGQP